MQASSYSSRSSIAGLRNGQFPQINGRPRASQRRARVFCGVAQRTSTGPGSILDGAMKMEPPGKGIEPVGHDEFLRMYDEECQRNGVPVEMQAKVRLILESPTGLQLLRDGDDLMAGQLINDAYKANMHNVYASYLQGVRLEFILNVRKTPVSLETVADTNPAVYQRLVSRCKEISSSTPYTPEQCDVLRNNFGFTPSESLVARAREFGVAPITWVDVDGLRLAVAEGPAEAASHVETNVMQAVQEAIVLAQVAQVKEETGHALSRAARLASSLAHLAQVLHVLNTEPDPDARMILMAGRRASDRLFLLLCNVITARLCRAYVGTSAISVAIALARAGVKDAEPLVGTLAHEMVSVMGQLLGSFDDKAGGHEGPVQVSALTAHLIFLLVNGGRDTCTALPDTFRTAAFLQVAAAAKVPEEFCEDFATRYPSEEPIPPKSRVIDLFRTYRVDSGDYEQVAGVIVAAWEDRCGQLLREGLPPIPRPRLIHSNLGSVEEVVEATKLPAYVRPTALGFGTLTDGFFPFETPEGQRHVKLASVVMKAVQARHPNVSSPFPCAAKQGDNSGSGKQQLDPRLPQQQREKAAARLALLCDTDRNLDSARVSAALRDAYVAVVREKLLC